MNDDALVTVTGQFLTPDTRLPDRGSISFRAVVAAVDATPEPGHIVTLAPVTAVLDEEGRFSVQLTASDDPGWRLADGQEMPYQVSIATTGMLTTRYLIVPARDEPWQLHDLISLAGPPDIIQRPGGTPGLSAFELAVQQGFEGTLDEWLDSLVGPASTVPGPPGPSAFQVAQAAGFEGTEEQWLASLRGEDAEVDPEMLAELVEAAAADHPGPPGDSAFDLAVAQGFEGTEAQWLASLQGAPSTVPGPPGPSAFQVAQAAGFEGTEEQWLASLVGAAGEPAGVRWATTIEVPAISAGSVVGAQLVFPEGLFTEPPIVTVTPVGATFLVAGLMSTPTITGCSAFVRSTAPGTITGATVHVTAEQPGVTNAGWVGDHSLLLNLDADDHPQYALVSLDPEPPTEPRPGTVWGAS